MYQLACLLLFAGIASSNVHRGSQRKGTQRSEGEDFYYWRDYNGVIPPDAFPGGFDLGGNPTYIGQTYFSGKKALVPTVITPGDRFAKVNINGDKQSTDQFTKILCSTDNSLFRWVPTDAKKIRLLTGCKQISGGVQSGSELKIGRANIQGRASTGRLFDDPQRNWYYLMVHDAKQNDIELKEYQVLTYNCDYPYSEE